jgi:metal-dependent hydrolase (beta-lactamase superfamily II)
MLSCGYLQRCRRRTQDLQGSTDSYGTWTVCFETAEGLTRAQVIGGLHLAGPELLNRIAPTVSYLSDDARPEFVVPLHCTGLRAKVALANTFGDRCVAGGVGIQVSIPAPQPPV